MKVAGVQMACSREKEANVIRAERLVRDASREGAQLVCLQELFSTIYFPRSADMAPFGWAEQQDGPTIRHFGTLARELGIYLVVPIFERDDALQGRFFNTAFLIGPSGDVMGKYRKIHLPETPLTCEKMYFAPGVALSPVLACGELQVGIMICYDSIILNWAEV